LRRRPEASVDDDRAPAWDNSAMTKNELHQMVDELPDGALEGAAVLLRGIIRGPIDPTQAWFWTPEWQAGEREADAELAAGKGAVYESSEEFIAHLEQSSASDPA